MIDFTMTRVLKAYQGAAAIYQGESTDVPVLLQPVGQPSFGDTIKFFEPDSATAVPSPLATFAPVQLGSRVVLLLPFMTNPSLQLPQAPETQYTYTPVWRTRSPVSRSQQTQVGHALPVDAPLSQIGNEPRHELIAAWTSAAFTPPAATAFATPLPPAGSAPEAEFLLYYDAMQQLYNTAYYPAPYTRVELECEGDELALLVRPVAPAREWDFVPGGADANFAARYMENPVFPTGYQAQIGAYLLTGERSP